MFNRITFTVLLLSTLRLNAFIPMDIGTALNVTSSVAGGLSSGIDLLETSEELMNEIEGEGSSQGQFTKDIKDFEREISNYESDLRYLGYSEREIENQIGRLSSSKVSLEQKMRALTKSIRNVKKIKNLFSKVSQTAGAMSGKGGTASDPANQAILATQQQALHLQIQQMKNAEFNELSKKASEVAFVRSASEEIRKSQEDLLKNIESQKIQRASFNSMNLSYLQSKAIQMSLALVVLGCVGLMFSFFRAEGLKLSKVGILGVILSLLIPSIINLYQSWLGV